MTPSTTTSPPSDLLLADRQLVDRCLSGDPRAWTDLYNHLHCHIQASIRAFLGRLMGDGSLVDEIAARVWFALVKNDFALLDRFDVRRGCRLQGFVCVLARAEARVTMRSERRRRLREQVASRHEANRNRDETVDEISHGEFLVTLTPAERAYYETALLARTPERLEYSQQNEWQLRHRVRKKLERFLSDAT